MGGGVNTGKDYATVKYDRKGNQIWVARYNFDKGDYARAIAVDPSGNVYVTGESWGINTGRDYATVKYDRDGYPVWVNRYTGPEDSDLSDKAFAIAVDPSGNVYEAGWSVGSETLTDYATIKYDREGNELWANRYNSVDNTTNKSQYDSVRAMAVDPAGNVYVTGMSTVSYEDEIFWDYTTVKYDKDGNEVWVRTYNGPDDLNDYAFAMAVDPSGNVYVTGQTEVKYEDKIFWEYATVKYDKDGNELWVSTYSGHDDLNDYARAIAVDPSGNVYVTGQTEVSYESNLLWDCATVKYDRDGNELWVARYDSRHGKWSQEAWAIAVDPSGNVYVTGWHVININGTVREYATIKYSNIDAKRKEEKDK